MSLTLQHTKIAPLMLLISIPFAALLLAQFVLQGFSYLLIPLALGAAAAGLFVTWKNWRLGVMVFLAWMLFEDLARKFMGNNMAVYFAKDVLAGACCLSFFSARVRERSMKVRPAFFSPFLLFLAWAVLEVFNPNSPSVWFGLLGLKLYFGYVPLFFLGYALLRSEADLSRFLLANVTIAAAIAGLGFAQAITGQTLLAPAELQEDIRALGTLLRRAPTNGAVFLRPSSVFVSDGRFASFLLLAWLLGFATTVYFYGRGLPARKWLVPIMAIFLGAIILSGSRSALLWTLISSAIIAPMFLRELKWKKARSRKIGTALVTTLVLGIFTFVFLSYAYPDALNSRVDFYQQTLSLSSPDTQLMARVVDYPIANIVGAFSFPNWLWGYGTGTCSLGGQYVTRILGASSAGVGVESGYGNLILELGIPGLLLWLVWTTALVLSAWGVVRQLRGSPLFPVGFVIFWFVFVVLFPGMLSGLGYENYVTNAYLCLLLGVLFGLPTLPLEHSGPARTVQTANLR